MDISRALLINSAMILEGRIFEGNIRLINKAKTRVWRENCKDGGSESETCWKWESLGHCHTTFCFGTSGVWSDL